MKATELRWQFKPYPKYKDSGVEWLGGGSRTLGSEAAEIRRASCVEWSWVVFSHCGI